MHSSTTVANKIIEIARGRGNLLTPMQLIKLVYIAHGWMLGLYSRPLTRDRIEAWKFGPVIPNLYHSVKHFRDQPISNQLNQPPGDELDPIEADLVGQVCEIYCKFDGVSLSNMTHQAGTPWAQVYVDGISNIPIPNDLIERHYREKSTA